MVSPAGPKVPPMETRNNKNPSHNRSGILIKLVSPAGFEPTLPASEASTLSS